MALTELQTVRLNIDDPIDGSGNFKDPDPAAPLFTDDEINHFLGNYSTEPSQQRVLLASADLLDAKAVAVVQFAIRASVGGTWAHDSRSLRDGYRDAAKDFRERGNEFADFTFAEVNTDEFTERNIVINKFLRENRG